MVWRPTGDGQIEVCVVHRPTRDDWTIPKGKLDRRESVLSCAVREVAEETGHNITLGRRLSDVTYVVNGRPKVVHYWAARADNAGSARLPDGEVDKVDFLPVAEALRRLDYDHDRELVEDVAARPIATSPLVIVRHAKAVSRSSWKQRDLDRPLDDAGHAQARALARDLEALGVERCLSSHAKRCVETVRPWAERRLATINIEWAISEEEFDPERAVAALGQLDEPAVVCSHRPALPLLLRHAGADIGEDSLAAGEFVVVHRNDGTVVATERHQA